MNKKNIQVQHRSIESQQKSCNLDPFFLAYLNSLPKYRSTYQKLADS